jgi:dihydroxy-acid dehydratase
VRDRRLDLLVEESQLAVRRIGWTAPVAPARGYAQLYYNHVLQADAGCDFDFLQSASQQAPK